MKVSRIIAAILAAMLGHSLMFGAAAQAIDKCKVKVDKKTGVIRVDATGVGGTVGWGSESGQATTPFFNDATCVASGKAKKCELADPATLAGKTPPDACTLYVDDGVAECSVWVRGCTPRNPPGIAGYEVIIGSVVFAGTLPYVADVDCPAGKKAIGGGGTQGIPGWWLDDSNPKFDGSGWTVQYSPEISPSPFPGLGEAWVVCADIAD